MAGRGRPSKNTKKTESKVKSVEKKPTEIKPVEQSEIKQPEIKQPEINIDELVAQKVAEILAQKELESTLSKKVEETIEEPKAKVKTKPSKRIKNRKFVPDNTIIRLEQNVDGKFIIADTRGSNYFIELNGYGDSTTMNFKDLKNYHGKHHSFLNKGKLRIVDVVSENGDIDFEDVIQDLNLQRIYESEKKISPLDIEYYITEEESLNEFSEMVRNSTEILETIVEVASIHYDRGEFNDNAKMDVLRQVSGNYDLFKSRGIPKNVRRVSSEMI
jgi:hypothetical protein